MTTTHEQRVSVCDDRRISGFSTSPGALVARKSPDSFPAAGFAPVLVGRASPAAHLGARAPSRAIFFSPPRTPSCAATPRPAPSLSAGAPSSRHVNVSASAGGVGRECPSPSLLKLPGV